MVFKTEKTLSQKLLFVPLRHRNFCANFARWAKPFLRFNSLLCGRPHWCGKRRKKSMSKNESLLTPLDANDRQSNFEVLRIFAMLLIVLHHLCQHGLWFPEGTALSKNVYISKFFYGWPGQLGNWLFILTSGYFVSKSEFSWKKVFKIWFQIFFFSSLYRNYLLFNKNSINWFFKS